MRTMFKYGVGFHTAVYLPSDAKVRHFDTQNGEMFIWAEVNADELHLSRRRQFVVLGTGHAIPEGAVYVASHLQDRVSFVWHLFELADG